MTIANASLMDHEKGITLPITTEFRQIAQKFAQQCPFPEKAPQIRQNTLAVCVVNAYLQLIDVPTRLAESDSWNPVMQIMGDVADLKVPGVGTFSCRAIAPENSTCYIPPEDWHNRAGYIAIALDETVNEATLLGFTPTINELEQVPLDGFGSIETLIDRIHELQTSSQTSNQISSQISDQTSSPEASTVSPLLGDSSGDSLGDSSGSFSGTLSGTQTAATVLGQWLTGAIADGWQAMENLLNPVDFNFAFRTGNLVNSSPADISRAKLVDLGLQLGESVQVALVIHLVPISANQSDIVLQVRPLGDSPYLYEGITLSVFDENDDLFRSATSRTIDNYIQIQIMGEPGEVFSIQVNKGETTFREQFVI